MPRARSRALPATISPASREECNPDDSDIYRGGLQDLALQLALLPHPVPRQPAHLAVRPAPAPKVPHPPPGLNTNRAPVTLTCAEQVELW